MDAKDIEVQSPLVSAFAGMTIEAKLFSFTGRVR